MMLMGLGRLLPWLLLLERCLSNSSRGAASGAVVAMETSCASVGPAETAGILRRDGVPLYSVDYAIMENGERVPRGVSHTVAGLDEIMTAIQSFGGILSPECKTRLQMITVPIALLQCVEVEGVAIPRKLCRDVCTYLWDVCLDSLGLLIGSLDTMPVCGQKGSWLTFGDALPRNEEEEEIGYNFVPEEYFVRRRGRRRRAEKQGRREVD